MQCNAVQYNATQCNVMQCNAKHSKKGSFHIFVFCLSVGDGGAASDSSLAKWKTFITFLSVTWEGIFFIKRSAECSMD